MRLLSLTTRVAELSSVLYEGRTQSTTERGRRRLYGRLHRPTFRLRVVEMGACPGRSIVVIDRIGSRRGSLCPLVWRAEWGHALNVQLWLWTVLAQFEVASCPLAWHATDPRFVILKSATIAPIASDIGSDPLYLSVSWLRCACVLTPTNSRLNPYSCGNSGLRARNVTRC
jgi:hypothetical protein